MSLLVALIIGLGLGALTGFRFKRNGDYMLIDLVVGLAGSLIGLGLAFITRGTPTSSLFSWRSTLACLLGAAIGLVLYQSILFIPKEKKTSVEKPDEDEED